MAPLSEIRQFASKQGLGKQLLAASAISSGERSFISAGVAADTDVPRPDMSPEAALAGKATINLGLYGFETQSDLFTDRQLVMLEEFANTIADVPDMVRSDNGNEAYAATVTSVLGLAIGKLAQSNSTQVRWRLRNVNSKAEPAFGRHAMPMVWDFAEVNPFGGSVGDWNTQVASVISGVRSLPLGTLPSMIRRSDARTTAASLEQPVAIITDPPYFDQISYADLSDFFYVWHRKALRNVHPDIYTTIVTPKGPELIATPHRHDGGKEAAADYFVNGFTEVFKSLKEASGDFPILIVYAHRQEESSSLGTASTGWDAMLEAVLTAGLTIEGDPSHSRNWLIPSDRAGHKFTGVLHSYGLSPNVGVRCFRLDRRLPVNPTSPSAQGCRGTPQDR